ncbi:MULTISPECIES: spermidine/putrescine ABC transporter substrate-binding protein [unclassified Leucobacter]|uniref:polyamine ABC transporter substrate-binding protein n=1 Tax=unclassified Leucobacter TaxID=2621730 RepID=UPI00165E8FC4|nr:MULTISPECIES: spermidine/putrescine ABC transporter substrate-binding protein [unclassified Leucobacter]MBC9936526.1 spermidine/putrescine ABC transporter substrate-binding protein [Leucobacter sp. cx-87]
MTAQFTRRNLLFMAGAGTAALWLSGCAPAQNSRPLVAPKAEIDGDLVYYAPTGYVPDELLQAFEQEYGVKVKQSYFSTVDELIQKLGTGMAADITFLPSNFFPRAVSAGLLLPIDHDKMENWSQVDSTFQNPPFDPNATHLAGPYAMGGVGLAYRKRAVPSLNGTWEDLWDLSPKLNSRTFIFDDVTVSMTMALGKLGLPTDTDSPEDLAQAADALIELRQSLGGFGSSAGEKLDNGEADLLMNYTGATLTTMRESSFADDIGFEFCRETLAFNADCLAIPAAAKHPGTALLFSDFLLRPENMEKIVNFVGFPIATEAGMSAYNQMVSESPFLAYDESMYANPDVWLATLKDQQLQLWNQAWTRVKASK